MADYNNDGFLDIFVANGGNQPNLIYTNPGNHNRWVKIKCIGTKSNWAAIGTRVTIYQKDTKQIREISGQTGGGYGAQNGLIAHFGLGSKFKVDSLTIYWPSGLHTHINKPEINKTLEIIEK